MSEPHRKAPRAVALAGDINRFLVTAEETRGALTLWEVLLSPGGGPRPHIHAREVEVAYVVEGEVVLRVGESEERVGAGRSATLPIGVPHWFRNETARPARVLLAASPGGLEGFFFEAGVAVPADAVVPPASDEGELARILAAAPRYGVTILPDGAGEEANAADSPPAAPVPPAPFKP